MNKKIFPVASAVLFCAFVLFTSCTDNPSKVQKEPPKLPPVESMSIDFSAFGQDAALKGISQSSTNNYDKAKSTAMFMRLIMQMHLEFPKALLKAAHNADAHFIEDGKWEWTFSETRDGNSFSVRLVAIRVNEEQVKWQFYVSSSVLELKDFLFFEGVTLNKGTEGSWTYYNLFDTGTNTPIFKITWTIKAEDDVEVRMEILDDFLSEVKGTYLEYTFDGTYKTIIYFDASTGQTTKIHWNVETKAGYIIAPDYNQGQKACWDSSFQDVPCSE